MNIKIITLNIWNGMYLDRVQAFLEQSSADIVLLQEVYSSRDETLDPKYRAYEQLINSLRPTYSCFQPEFRDLTIASEPVIRGNVILSKFPIVECGVVDNAGQTLPEPPTVLDHYENGGFLLQFAKLETPTKPLYVFNLHGVWDLDGDAYSPPRQAMHTAMDRATRVVMPAAIVLAGDTNADPTNQAFTKLNHLHSVFGTSLPTTFNMSHKQRPGYAHAAVDMVLTSPELHIITHDCPQVDVSDHYPLEVVLSL